MNKLLMAVVFGFALPSNVSWAEKASVPLSAAFVSVTGKVTVKDKKGKTRPAQKDAKAFEGETVKVDSKGSAGLRLFDGSNLDLQPDTEVVLKTLQQPAKDQKNIRFKLDFGTLLAKVQKLLSARSTFEVEGGGVVCGVRGTKFQVSYDPDSDQFDLQVFEGSVFTNSGGQNNLFKAGDQMQFLNGLMQAPQAPSQNPGVGGFNDQTPNSGGDQITGADTTGWGDSTSALGDLSGQFDSANGINSDNAFADPSVGGTAHITIHVVVPAQETHP